MFEYLMPLLWMRSLPGTLLHQSALAAVHSQRKFTQRWCIPWGISESSCHQRNPDGHYRYHAFGIPALARHRDLSSGDVVISPYSSFLAMLVDAPSALRNLQELKELGCLAAYGFYEAVDFTPSRVTRGQFCEMVRCWMAHHQGMSLVAVANLLCGLPDQRRFHSEPCVSATERLLQEEVPSMAVIEQTDEPNGGERPAWTLVPQLFLRPSQNSL